MIKLRIKDTLLSLDIGFLSVIALISLSGGSYWGYSFLACILHEIGHIIAVLMCHGSIKAVKLSVYGMNIIPCNEKLNSFWNDIMISASGPLVNISAGILMLGIKNESIEVFAVTNFILGIFNLLPFLCLDGGNIIVFYIRQYGKENENKLFILRKITAFSLCIAAVVFMHFYHIENISVYIIVIYLFISEIISKLY